MNRKKLSLFTAILLLSAVSFQSCIGSFSLTNKVLAWNRNVNNKFVNELVFFAFWVLPVYEVTAAADLLVINSIEFWSGNQPLEADNKVIETENGNYYINAFETGYLVTSPSGDVLRFDFDIDTQTWSFSQNEKPNVDFLKFKDAEHVQIINGNGVFVDVEISDDGINDYLSSCNMPAMAWK